MLINLFLFKGLEAQFYKVLCTVDVTDGAYVRYTVILYVDDMLVINLPLLLKKKKCHFAC